MTRTSSLARVISLSSVTLVVACTTVLGDFEVASGPGGPEVDASLDVTPGPGPDGAPRSDAGDAGDGGTDVRTCTQPSDCPVLAMDPAGCARANCESNRCVYVAVDKDNDTHPIAGCRVGAAVLPGDDCADDDPKIFPGAACTKTESGEDILYPTAAGPVGACVPGKWECSLGKPTCNGAIAPAPAEDCTKKNDANCNGTKDEGCDCTPGTIEGCGVTKGICVAGTRTCSPTGKWGACSDVKPKARDCASALDNDCNGVPDKSEAACNCPGGVAQGGTQSCTASAQGECAKGTRTCMPSGSTGVFGACNPRAAGALNCGSPLDNDCKNGPDEAEVACGSPCLDPLGSGAPVNAVQKFTTYMWGCPGRRNFGARNAGCGLGGSACSVSRWTDYIRKGGKRPTHVYWVSEQLNWGGSGTNACWAAEKATSACAGSSMAVCPVGSDSNGNQCNWTGCTSGTADGVDDALGGCVGANTGGTLCCVPIIL